MPPNAVWMTTPADKTTHFFIPHFLLIMTRPVCLLERGAVLLLYNQLDKIGDCAVRFDGVSQMLVKIDFIRVSSSFAISAQVLFIPEIRDYPLHRALGDPDLVRDFPHTH
jgi:hypothetical protein